MERDLNQIITERLNNCRARYLTPNNKWNLIFPHCPIKVNDDYINIRFSKYNWAGVMRVSYPFQISDVTAYMFGLILGSARRQKNSLILSVDTEHIAKIEDFCNQFNVTPKIVKINTKSENCYNKDYNRYFNWAMAYIPNSIFQYMKSLGLNIYKPKIPTYFTPHQKHLVISGYLNSKKTVLLHHCTSSLYLKVQIHIRSQAVQNHSVTDFGLQILNDLKKYTIISKLEKNKFDSIITVSHANIPKFQEQFNILRPQIKIRAKFIERCQKNPHITRTINLYKFNTLQLTILEIAFYYFYQKKTSEIAYTHFEELLTCDSDTIKKCLIDFQEKELLGLFNLNLHL